jgi:hypothetical protein
VLGGALINLNLLGADWRAIFYVNVPIGLAALAAGIACVGESVAPDADRLDLPGAIAVTTGLFLLVLPLVIGRDQGWPAWSLIMPAGSVPVLAGFTWYERALSVVDGRSRGWALGHGCSWKRVARDNRWHHQPNIRWRIQQMIKLAPVRLAPVRPRPAGQPGFPYQHPWIGTPGARRREARA